MYEGKEICQGCKKPGNEMPRWSKNDLCKSCKEEINLGRAKDKELNEEYVRITAWPNKSGVEFGDKTLSTFLMDFLKTIDNPNAEHSTTVHHPFNSDNIHGGTFFTIPARLLEPLKEFFSKMDDFVWEIRKEKEDMPKMAVEAVQSEKNRIYNEGIEKGRNLLFQLNEGEITQDDFSKNVGYKEK